jgi:predicted AAA+ superfamily ATPase
MDAHLAKREVGRQKGLILDSGLAARLARVTVEQLQSITHGEAFRAFLEGFVAAELRKQQTWAEHEFELFHYRDRAGIEVDLVLELTGGQVIGIQVKSAISFKGEHFKALKTLRDQLGERFVAGIVLNTGAAGYRYGERLYGLPIDALWKL